MVSFLPVGVRRYSAAGEVDSEEVLSSMIDTHAHVHVKHFAGDRERVLNRAFASGITAILEVNIGPRGWPRVRALAEADPRIFATVGIHPHSAREGSLQTLAELEPWLEHPRVRAVGETGLDAYRKWAPFELQEDLFRRHVALARETGLPLVVHCRQAYDPLLRILEEEGRGRVRGILHCFSGGLEEARRLLDMGFALGLGGSITYDAKRWAPLVQALGLEGLVLETDCPYVTPEPYRGRRNEPAFVWETAGTLARYLGVPVEEVEAATDRTARQILRLERVGGTGEEG
jgi:TatD DNase family protein